MNVLSITSKKGEHSGSLQLKFDPHQLVLLNKHFSRHTLMANKGILQLSNQCKNFPIFFSSSFSGSLTNDIWAEILQHKLMSKMFDIWMDGWRQGLQLRHILMDRSPNLQTATALKNKETILAGFNIEE